MIPRRVRISLCEWQLPQNQMQKNQEMIMTRTFATVAIALSLVVGASVAQADSSLMVHGYQGTVYGGR